MAGGQGAKAGGSGGKASKKAQKKSQVVRVVEVSPRTLNHAGESMVQPALFKNKEIFAASINLPTSKDGVVTGVMWLAPSWFEWLNGVAANFQKYRWKHLRVGFTSIVGDNTDGVITVGRNCDMRDAGPKTTAQAFTMAGSAMGPVHSGLCNSVVGDLAVPFPKSGIGFDLGPEQLKRTGGGKWLEYASKDALSKLSPEDRDSRIEYLVNWVLEGGDGSGKKVGFLWASYAIECCDPISAALNL